MRRTEQAQGLRLMKFEEIYGRTLRGELSQAEAAEVLGMSERTFRRWRDRFEADGAEGLYDRRLGRVSARRAPVDEVVRVLALFDTRYWDFTAKHFHEKLVAEHGCKRSYNWVRLTLQARGRMRPAPRRGAHRRKRPRRALPGMMVHQDGSRHEWVPGRWWDLIVTMDDATSEIYSAFFVEEEGTMSSFRALSEVNRHVDGVEELVQRDEGGALHVPVRLLHLGGEVHRVGQSGVEQCDHRGARVVGNVDLRGVQCLGHDDVPFLTGLRWLPLAGPILVDSGAARPALTRNAGTAPPPVMWL